MSTENEQQNEQQKVTITFPNGQVASRIVDQIVRTKPLGWSRRSRASYFTEEYGKWLIKTLDSMIETGESKVFPYESWPRLSPNSLYLRVLQSWNFVRDYLDPDKRYEQLWLKTVTRKIRGRGVTISFRKSDDVSETGSETFVHDEGKPRWLTDMDKWLEDVTDIKPFHRHNLVLTEDQIKRIKNELEGLENIIFSVSSKEIKIITKKLNKGF